MGAAAVNWCNYFDSIQNVCPWSKTAWRNGAIDIQTWHSQIYELDDLEVRLYIAPRHNPRQLKKMSNRFNELRPNDEWLWSHPDFGFNSTPVPVFIQQDRAKLNSIRSKITKNNE
mgnify:FL=1